MDLLHSFSNLEIENQHPYSSSSSQKVEEEEVKRNWVELPEDVMSVIFLKLGTVDILASAQWVCTSWWKLSKQPHLFRSIHADHVDKVPYLFDHFRSSCSSSLLNGKELSRGMVREAIDRSCGQLEEFSVGVIATNELLEYMSEKSSSLRCLGLVFCEHSLFADDGLIEIAKKLPQLEELEIIEGILSDFSIHVTESFGRSCPQLKSCRLNYGFLDEAELDRLALAIAENMPGLRHLNLLGGDLTIE